MLLRFTAVDSGNVSSHALVNTLDVTELERVERPAELVIKAVRGIAASMRKLV